MNQASIIAAGYRRRQAFTLVDLLEVTAIIGVLIGLLLPAVQQIRQAAARLKCQNNLKQIGLALHRYVGDYGRFPAGDNINTEYCLANDDCRGNSMFAYLLSYLDQQNIVDQYDFDAIDGWGPNASAPFASVQVSVYKCPSNDSQYAGSTVAPSPAVRRDYFGVAGCVPFSSNAGTYGYCCYDGMFQENGARTAAMITDGLSNTLAIGESNPPFTIPATQGLAIPVPWEYGGGCSWPDCPQDNSQSYGRVALNTFEFPINFPIPAGYKQANDYPFGSNHPTGTNFLFCDGHVSFVNENVNFFVYQLLTSIADGHSIPGDTY